MEFLAPERLQHKISAHKRRPRVVASFASWEWLLDRLIDQLAEDLRAAQARRPRPYTLRTRDWARDPWTGVPSTQRRIPIPRPDLQVPGDKVQLLFKARSIPHGSAFSASRAQLAPAPFPRPPPPSRAGNCHASPFRLHQLSS